MDIEELVKKHYEEWPTVTEAFIQDQMRAALTELAAGYEQRITVIRQDLAMIKASLETRTTHLSSCEQALAERDERIRQLEAERGVPEGWRSILEELAEDCEHHIRIDADTGDNPMTERERAMYRLPIDKARAMLASAKQPKKEWEE